MPLQLPAVGARINHTSNLGTVRFVGQVDGTEGIWLGVEWDDPKRGKHSGMKDGKQYFLCKVPNSASFIRPNVSIILGCSFLQALSSKYVELPFAATEKVTLGSSKGAIEVEAVGMDKVRSKLSKLERLREVSLDKENIAWADDPGQIRLRCPNIKGLDLSRSLLGTWVEVARITEELPLLETLTLNFNRLQMPDENSLGVAFARVRDLRLNKTFTAWEEMLRLLPSFPKLVHLELGLNNIEQLSLPAPLQASTNIATLNLQENRLRNWQGTMQALASLKQLDRLILSENMFDNIPSPSSSSKLPQLKQLILTSNNLRSWSDINALPAWFPSLQTLNINFNAISQDKSARPLIIARISTLSTLNASAISASERRDSELFYLSSIAKSGVNSEEARAREYPRYLELSRKHGQPAEQQEQLPDTLKNRLIATLFFRTSQPAPPEPDVDLSEPDFTLRVLPSMSLRVLRLKVLKTLKLPQPTNIRMWLVLERGTLKEFAELEIAFANKPLEWWSTDDNSKFVYYVQ